MERKQGLGFVLGLAAALVLTAGATDYTWQGGDGAFTNSAKWSPASVPGAGDRAKFSTAADGTVTWTAPVVNNEMAASSMNGKTLVLDLGGNAYTLTNRFYFEGDKARSYLVVSNGFLTALTNTCDVKINSGVAPASLTFASGAVAAMDRMSTWQSDVTVSSGAVVTCNNECKIGDGQANVASTLNVNGGCLTNNYRLWVNTGGANSTSTLNITAGKLLSKDYFSIGDKGNGLSWGIFNLSGGELETQGQVWIGNSGYARGVANISGGLWTSKSTLEVGHREYSIGWLNMTGGQILCSNNFGVAYAGAPYNSTGIVSMLGGRITVTNSGMAFILGNGSNALAQCTVGGAGEIFARDFRVGTYATARGECLVTGGLIQVFNSLSVGDVNKSYGWLRIDGGAVSNLYATYIGNNTGSTGVLELASGALVATNCFYAGQSSGANGRFTMSGGAFSASTCYIGTSGYGVLELSGGSFSATNSFIAGSNAGATGKVVMTGGTLFATTYNFGNSGYGSLVLSNGTLRSINNLTVGVNGTGSVEIAGGFMSVSNIFVLGNNARSRGTAVMTGGEAVWTNGCKIGDWGGDGVFELKGGTITCPVGGALVGNGNGSSGLLTISGGRMLCNNYMTVGNNAYKTKGRLEMWGGELMVSNSLTLGGKPYTWCELAMTGGVVNAKDFALSKDTNCYASAYFGGGAFTNRNYFDVGSYGTGILQVAGGQVVTHILRTTPNNYTAFPTPVVEILVSGGRLVVTNYFYFADAVGSTGRVTLTGGTFALPKLSTSRGYTDVICDGGELEATRTEPYFIDTSLSNLVLTANGLYVDSAGFTIATSRNLSDAPGQQGKLGKRGLGKFTLNVSATFTGPVAVEAGELALGASGLVTLAGGCAVDGGALLNLSARALDFTLPAGTFSRVDGEVRLASGKTLTVTNGATLSGTGVVGRVVFAAGAQLARSAASGGAVLHAAECVIPAGATIALTGYTAQALRQGVAVVAGGSLTVAQGGGVAVTLDGVAQSPVALRVSGGTLTAYSYNPGTLIRVQ